MPVRNKKTQLQKENTKCKLPSSLVNKTASSKFLDMIAHPQG